MEALGGLTAGIAHDFNNILSLINGYSELAMHDVPPDSPVSEKLKIIHNAGKNAVSLTKGLLSFGRKKNFLLEPVDIKSELQNLNNFIRKGLPENINLEISSDFEPGKYVRGDSGMLQQVFINLCLNARDAMPDGGTIKVCPAFVEISEIPPSAPPDTGKGEYISVMFKDNGAGIPEKLIPKIFDPFFSTKEKRGTGLGLAMVEKIIRNHHGWIDVTSAPGQGSTFTIFLPVIKKHNPPREAREPFQHNRKESRNAVIVVDDDEIQLSMLKFYLKKAKYDVTTALSSEEAIKIIEKAPDKFHTAIIDHVMPGMTGSQSCTLIRERWPHIKTILVSGAGNVPLTGDFFLRKPFTARDLLLIFEAIK
jgi:CheY-like chemotaxis protein